MITVLVVEDDEKLNRIVCLRLEGVGYKAIGCKNPYDAFDVMATTAVDLVISDIMMPRMDGFEFAELLRKNNDSIPILFMSARDDLSAKQRGFRLGIDDYMVKPVDLDELLMRTSALLRRANIAIEKTLSIGNLVMKADETAAYVDGEQIHLTVREFNILFKLLSYPKKTFTRNQLMSEFWDTDSESTPRTVDVYIAKLREKIAACPAVEILTVHGLGYKAVIK
ncbi:MAG: response regulator transcription factor [Raoultibacter sp.]